MIIFGQCDKTTKVEIALGTNYTVDCQAGRLIEFQFLSRLRTVNFGVDVSLGHDNISFVLYKSMC